MDICCPIKNILSQICIILQNSYLILLYYTVNVVKYRHRKEKERREGYNKIIERMKHRCDTMR